MIMEMLTANNMENILPSVVRTQGDGMENMEDAQAKLESLNLSSQKEKKSLVNDFIYRPADLNHCSVPPPVIKGPLIDVTPHNVTASITSKKGSAPGFKTKEPKFVPYEPYKAAVKPIVPVKKHKGLSKRTSISSEESITALCPTAAMKSKAGTIGTLDLDKLHPVQGKSEDEEAHKISFQDKHKELKEEIRKLKEEKLTMESELNCQVQVNGELKKLLVAAVGEDLETRVNHLTEDKLQLARALLSSAQRLSTHQDQTEWLAGQCEVWRSKFLASSLMVEELARWKAALSQRALTLQNALQCLLNERSKLHCLQLDLHKKLTILRENFDVVSTVSGTTGSARRNLQTTNVLELATANQRLCEILTIQLLGSALDRRTKPLHDYENMEQYTAAEQSAIQLLEQPVSELLAGDADAACSAVMGAAMALGGSHMFPHSTSFACCAHCSGEVKQV